MPKVVTKSGKTKKGKKAAKKGGKGFEHMRKKMYGLEHMEDMGKM